MDAPEHRVHASVAGDPEVCAGDAVRRASATPVGNIAGREIDQVAATKVRRRPEVCVCAVVDLGVMEGNKHWTSTVGPDCADAGNHYRYARSWRNAREDDE